MRPTHLLAVGLAAMCALATTALPAAATVDAPATAEAAAYVAAQIVDGDHVTSPWGDVGATADSLLALEASGDAQYDDEIAAMLGYLKTNAASYAADGPEAAAKLAIVAAATTSGEPVLLRIDSAKRADTRARRLAELIACSDRHERIPSLRPTPRRAR